MVWELIRVVALSVPVLLLSCPRAHIGLPDTQVIGNQRVTELLHLLLLSE